MLTPPSRDNGHVAREAVRYFLPAIEDLQLRTRALGLQLGEMAREGNSEPGLFRLAMRLHTLADLLEAAPEHVLHGRALQPRRRRTWPWAEEAAAGGEVGDARD